MIEYKVVSVMSGMQKTVRSVIDICIIGIIVEAFYHIMVCQICISVSHHKVTVPFIVFIAVKQFDKCKKKNYSYRFTVFTLLLMWVIMLQH